VPAGAVTPPPTPASAEERRRLEPWRRFHFGDPVAELPTLPERTLPVALHALRGITVRSGWPLLVDPTAEGESFAQSLGAWLQAQTVGERSLADNRSRVEARLARTLAGGAPRPAREALAAACAGALEEIELGVEERGRFRDAAKAMAEALPPQALLVALGPDAPLQLAELAARRRTDRARRRFAAQTGELTGAIDALLESDRERRRDGEAPAAGVGKLGNLGARFVDSSRLSGVVAHRKQGAPLPEERRRRLESARELLAALEREPAANLWIVPASFTDAVAEPKKIAEDTCAAAAAAFDERAAATLELIRAARLAKLEVTGEVDPGRYVAALERLDWRGLGADELALVPPVLAVVSAAALAGAGLASLVALLQSGRPVQVLLLDAADGEAAAADRVRFDPAYLGIGLREVYVHQGSPARPEALARGLERALAGSRPGLHVIDRPWFGTPDLDVWLVASARVSGRATPLLRFEPEAGASWARRMRFDDNPEPTAEWPEEPVAAALAGSGPPPMVRFTYADAALLDPSWSAHFSPVDAASDDLVPLADWLELEPEQAGRSLPFVWGATPGGEALRLAVTRALAFATRDRLGLWRTLEELAGLRNEHVEEAIARTRREADERAAREREALVARHAAELDGVRAAAAAAAVDHLVSTLFEVEPQFERATPAGSAGQTGRPATLQVQAVATPESAPAAGAEPAPAAAAEPAAAPAQEDAWIDTALCTSCDECIRKYPSIFAYNADKQAYVKDPRGGTFKDLVSAAEMCTAKVIHPGTPWNSKEPDLDDLVTRAQAFA